MTDTKLLEAFTRLTALNANLPLDKWVPEKWVLDYHTILDILEKQSATDLNGFRVPSAELRRVLISRNDLTGRRVYSKDFRCEKRVMKAKLDAVLSFFEFQLANHQKAPIGFAPP